MRLAALAATAALAASLAASLDGCAGTPPPGQNASAGGHHGFEDPPIGSLIGGGDAVGPTGDANSPGLQSRSNQVSGH